jgi:hypothetical protein
MTLVCCFTEADTAEVEIAEVSVLAATSAAAADNS